MRHNESNCFFEGMFNRTIYVKTAGSYEIWRTKEFRKRKWVTIDQNRNSRRIISILLSHHTLKLKINKTHYEAVHAPCL